MQQTGKVRLLWIGESYLPGESARDKRYAQRVLPEISNIEYRITFRNEFQDATGCGHLSHSIDPQCEYRSPDATDVLATSKQRRIGHLECLSSQRLVVSDEF